MENHNYCQNLYEEWKDLEKRVEMKVQELKKGEKIEIKYISVKDMRRVWEVRQELLNTCKDMLSPEEKFELQKYISNDQKK